MVVEGSVPPIRDLNRAPSTGTCPTQESNHLFRRPGTTRRRPSGEKQAFTFHGNCVSWLLKRDRNRITRLRIKPVEATAKARK